jgi:hypothetical protein
VAAANTLSPAKLLAKPLTFLIAMSIASASAGVDVTGHMYTSSKQVLAGYIMKIRGKMQGELLAKKQGEIQLLLLQQQGEMQLLLLADPSGTTSEGIGPADTTSGRVSLLQSPSCCRKRTRLQRDGNGGGAKTTPTGPASS